MKVLLLSTVFILVFFVSVLTLTPLGDVGAAAFSYAVSHPGVSLPVAGLSAVVSLPMNSPMWRRFRRTARPSFSPSTRYATAYYAPQPRRQAGRR